MGCLASLYSDYVLDKGRSTWRKTSCDIVRCSMREQFLNFIFLLLNDMSVFVTSVRALASQVEGNAECVSLLFFFELQRAGAQRRLPAHRFQFIIFLLASERRRLVFLTTLESRMMA